MPKKLILKIILIIMSIVGIAMFLPAAVALIYHETWTALSFIICAVPLTLLGIIGINRFSLGMHIEDNLSIAEGFLIVGLTWLLMSLFGALPFVISGDIPFFIDAFFETASGFTTTGASILTDVEALSQGALFWRSFTHWIGGMGILVLTTALLTKLGIGGQRLVNAESTGPIKDKSAATYKKSAALLYRIYLVITIAEIIILCLCGMNLFDSCIHSFGSVGTGGFSNYAKSVGAFNSLPIEIVIGIFTLMCGVNFGIYALIVQGDIKKALSNTELKVYLAIVAFSVIFIGIQIHSFRDSFFTVSSIITTTGYATADYDLWPAASKYILMLLMFIGGCAGSTGGGMKVIRIVMLFKFIREGMKARLHPSLMYTAKIDGRKIDQDIMMQSAGFISLYLGLTFVGALIVALSGIDFTSSFAASLACISNIGPGFGMVGPTCNFSFLPPLIKVFLSVLMIAGRLELYTIILMFNPDAWRARKKHMAVQPDILK